jgi:hypothetical protein
MPAANHIGVLQDVVVEGFDDLEVHLFTRRPVRQAVIEDTQSSDFLTETI